VLDIRLFDIAALVAAGYDDASRPTLPSVERSEGACNTPPTHRGRHHSDLINKTATSHSSYGGGQTWPATVRGNAQLILQHQAGAEAVSLRAKAVDGNGNTVEQAIINAYKLR
jgi:hypothetical protein